MTSLTGVNAVRITNVLQERKNRYFEWYKKLVRAGLEPAQCIWANLSPITARPDLQLCNVFPSSYIQLGEM